MTLVEETSDVQSKIAECIDACLKELGQSVKKVVYFQLEKNFRIKKEEIPNQPETFSKALHSIFGEGAKVIENLIVHEIEKNFKLHLKLETSLVEAIQAVKKSCKQRLDNHSEKLMFLEHKKEVANNDYSNL